MASDEIERREFFRISDRLLIEFREVGYPESLALEKSLKQPDLFFGRPEYPAAAPAGPASRKSELYVYLETIERKLDAVIDLLSKSEDRFRSTYIDVTISGSGLKFRSSSKLQEGAYLELGIGLPLYPALRIKALGKVVRSDLSQKGGEESWETAVGFVAISEKDRDVLVSYVFSRERECLRMRQMSRRRAPG